MDYAKPRPKFERLKNYIQFVNEQKFIEESNKLVRGLEKKNKKNSILNKQLKQKLTPAE